jgi:hypothetical protein
MSPVSFSPFSFENSIKILGKDAPAAQVASNRMERL